MLPIQNRSDIVGESSAFNFSSFAWAHSSFNAENYCIPSISLVLDKWRWVLTLVKGRDGVCCGMKVIWQT